MKVEEGKVKGLKREFKVVIPAKDMEKIVEAKLDELAKTTKLPGFRPGKAPKAMLKQKYRANVLGDALDEAVNKATTDIIKDKKLNIAMFPDVKITKFEDGKDIEFDMNVEILPEIKLGDFSKIELEKPVAEVPEEEVMKTLEYIAQSRRENKKVEENRATKKGDVAVIDFAGSVDGEEFQGGKGANYPLELGSGSFIPGFEEQLIGKKVGDEVDVKVKFPATYHAKDLADKDAVFAVKINELREPVAVKIDDEFAKSLGEESLAKVKESIKSRISGDYENATRMKLKRTLLDILDKEYKFELPESMVEQEYKGIVDSYEQAKKHNQLDESEKAKSSNELLAEYKDIAARRVKLGLLLAEVSKLEKITVSPDDVNKAIMKEAQKYPGQEKAVFDYYLKNKQAIESLKAPIMEEKIVDNILGKVKLKDKKVSVEELYNFDDTAKPAKAKKASAKAEEVAEAKEEKKPAAKKIAKKEA